MNATQAQRISIRVSGDQAERIRQIAEKTGESMGTVIRSALREFLANDSPHIRLVTDRDEGDS